MHASEKRNQTDALCADPHADFIDFQTQLGQIRDLIDEAIERPQGVASLVDYLAEKTPSLHTAIDLPDESASLRLADFVVRYIEHVPDFIEAIYEIFQEASLLSQLKPLLDVATGYFLKPPSLVHRNNPLEALLEEAYLAHRLLEEINDRFILHCNQPLVPMDTTRANLVAHELIGEPFANELDQAVLFSAELLLCEYDFSGAAFKKFFCPPQKKRLVCGAVTLALPGRRPVCFS